MQTSTLDLLTDTRRRHIGLMKMTAATIGNLVATLSQEQATTDRDGPDGWTILEVLGHLRDFDAIFRRRVEQMLAEEYPTLPAYDHEAMAIERAYNQQQLSTVVEDFRQSRRQTIDLFKSLAESQWERAGLHPERGHFPVTAACIQVGTHDVVHLEQITKILRQRLEVS